MVGIIIVSHGELANGVHHSSEMIFGKQEDVKVCMLAPSDGPESIKAQIEEAAASLSQSDEVLIFADLWGGTPFNQASLVMEGHPNWAIVTGVNLPMVVEAYVARMAEESAHEIAKKVAISAQESVKIKPENLMEAAKPKAKKNVLEEGSVVGNGKIEYVLARIDTRLLHGQVATTWTKTTMPNRIIVVSDSVAKDELRKNMIIQAAPPGVKANVVPIDKMIQVAKDPRFGKTKALLLFETPQDALRAIEGGVEIDTLNLGSMAHTLGKVAVTTAVSLDKKDIETFNQLLAKNIKIDVRKVPADSPKNITDLLKKAKEELK